MEAASICAKINLNEMVAATDVLNDGNILLDNCIIMEPKYTSSDDRRASSTGGQISAITSCAITTTNSTITMTTASSSMMTHNPHIQSGIGMAALTKLQERYVWEMRTRSPDLTPASTVLNSPDLNTDLQYLPHPHQSRQMQQIRVGRSPVNQFDQHNLLPQSLGSPGSPTDVGNTMDGQCLRDGEIVVFDDIDTNWMNKSCNHQSSVAGNEDVLKVTKMIGQLPIAEYEGSPRRFGNQPLGYKAKIMTSFPKRPPGFPQRISPQLSTMSMQQQQLYHQQQEVAHARHQQMQRQHQFYAQVTSNNHSNSNILVSNSVMIKSPSTAALLNTNREKSNSSNDHNNSSINFSKEAENLIDMENDSLSNLMTTETKSNDDAETMSNEFKSVSNRTPAFDYLYEFSETRKVLEEFFKPNHEDDKQFKDFVESEDVESFDSQLIYKKQHQEEQRNSQDNKQHINKAYIGQRLAKLPKDKLYMVHQSPNKQKSMDPVTKSMKSSLLSGNRMLFSLDNNDGVEHESQESRSSGGGGDILADQELESNVQRNSRNFTLSPETTDYDSNCGDLDSLSNDMNCNTDFGKLYTSMPILEDGLSSGHASDTETTCQQYDNNNGYNNKNINADSQSNNINNNNSSNNYKSDRLGIGGEEEQQLQHNIEEICEQNDYNSLLQTKNKISHNNLNYLMEIHNNNNSEIKAVKTEIPYSTSHSFKDLSTKDDIENEPIYATINKQSLPSPTLAPTHTPQKCCRLLDNVKLTGRERVETVGIEEAMKEIRSALQRAKYQPEKLKFCDEVLPAEPESPIWVPRKAQTDADNVLEMSNEKDRGNEINDIDNCEEEEQDTDLETDRLLGQQRNDDDCAYLEEKGSWSKNERALRSTLNSNNQSPSASEITMLPSHKLKQKSFSSATIRQGIGTSLTPTSPDSHSQHVHSCDEEDMDSAAPSPTKLEYSKSPSGSIKSLKNSTHTKKSKTRNKEGLLDATVLIEGVLFRARYLGSTQLVCEGQPTKSTRMMQAEEAVSRIKAPEGESQPSTEVDLFISTEKIMVLNTDLKEIMMDHALRTISYIADIGDLVVLMARRRFVHSDPSNSVSNVDDSVANNANLSSLVATDSINSKDKDFKDTTVITEISTTSTTMTTPTTTSTTVTTTSTSTTNNLNNSNNSGNNSKNNNRTPKMICHVFESDEAQFIAQSIGQAFQVAYMEFLKANGIENENLAKEMDYQEVLNSQEIFGDELEIFAKKELQKEVVVPKGKGEILGVVIVESGWGSMLPTVVIANLMSGGAAARCGQLNIGDQLIAINGLSLVGLPLSTCQNYIRNAKNQTAIKFTVVPCPPVVEVKILRPKALFQLGFSVQNGVICSLLRGGIAERGGVRVGHRIIEINNQSVVAVPHDTIVKLLSSSVGEILMKTMPTSMFRLLTGQETPIYI